MDFGSGKIRNPPEGVQCNSQSDVIEQKERPIYINLLLSLYLENEGYVKLRRTTFQYFRRRNSEINALDIDIAIAF